MKLKCKCNLKTILKNRDITEIEDKLKSKKNGFILKIIARIDCGFDKEAYILSPNGYIFSANIIKNNYIKKGE